ncbi:lipoyl(octanoyl) transferase LipB [Coraliomargarita parva]|uniref:lipoyl(octanoyl) transferase LipB n=1 Tax=Coraliomargarita parva TaxID=3014050 RepID=UPI0022B4B1A2|nr:lipoyl(octanoyl) transferase LipB [Coraliomargarita parva]
MPDSQKEPSVPTSKLEVVDWGRTRYSDAFERQKAMVLQRREGQIGDTLIFTEHHPVYTVGLRKDADRHLVWSEAALKAAGIEFVRSNRGGDITYHGPGQVVGYPIVSLQHKRDLHAYLRDLEETVIRTMTYFGLETGRREGKTGIWLEDRKICAIGVAVRSWITYHGFALNVCPNLQHFSGIVPCGITDGTVTSMEKELAAPVDMEAVKARLAVEFRQVFLEVGRSDGKS